ncbi:MAG: hypothetical protein ACRCXC_06650 [Legionella sp.]
MSSLDEEQIKLLIDKGYIGVRFIKHGLGNVLADNKIVFEKYRIIAESL